MVKDSSALAALYFLTHYVMLLASIPADQPSPPLLFCVMLQQMLSSEPSFLTAIVHKTNHCVLLCSFKDNQKHGEGIGVLESTWVYRGAWRKGVRWGSGSCSYVDGSTYEGHWKADQRSGSGTMKRPDGYCYTGEWLDDKPHGSGE
jgi:hypothetical protein